MSKFGNKNFRNIGSASNKILQRLDAYRPDPFAEFTFGGKSFNNIASSGTPVYQRLPSFHLEEELGELSWTFQTIPNTGNRGNNRRRITWSWSSNTNTILSAAYPGGSHESICYNSIICSNGYLKYAKLTLMFGTPASGDTLIVSNGGVASTGQSTPGYYGTTGDESNFPPAGGEIIDVAGLGKVLIVPGGSSQNEYSQTLTKGRVWSLSPLSPTGNVNVSSALFYSLGN